MSACEKCWRESRGADNYRELLESRKENPCTPEEQAGPDAGECPACKRMTLHQYMAECMNRCGFITHEQTRIVEAER